MNNATALQIFITSFSLMYQAFTFFFLLQRALVTIHVQALFFQLYNAHFLCLELWGNWRERTNNSKQVCMHVNLLHNARCLPVKEVIEVLKAGIFGKHKNPQMLPIQINFHDNGHRCYCVRKAARSLIHLQVTSQTVENYHTWNISHLCISSFIGQRFVT